MDTLLSIIIIGLFVLYIGIDYAENNDEAILVHIITLLRKRKEEDRALAR